MPRQYKDGWHIICGYDVYVEDGMVVRAIKTDVNGWMVPASVYARDRKNGGWTNVYREVKAETFRRGMYEGRYIVS